MLIYNDSFKASKLNSNLKSKRRKGGMKSKKKEYKSISNRMPELIRIKALEQKRPKKPRKKLSKNFRKFLEGLGLKVKHR